MTSLWTTEQITAHATWLRQTHGDEVETLSITETADDHGVNVTDFTGDDWDAYIEAVETVLRSAPDLTEWEIGLGGAELEPHGRALDAGEGLRFRVHFAFAKDMSDDDRNDLIAQFAAFMVHGLT